MSQLVPTIRTTPSMRDFASALLETWRDASKAAAGVLYSQFAGETGRGKHCYGWSLGNVKWTPGCGYDYHALSGVWEGVSPATAERLIASGQWRADPSADHAKAVGPGKVSIIALPSNPASWFRAYPSLDVGMRVFIDGKRKPGYRYSSAWAYALAGDCDGYARELGAKGYYTASPDAYSRSMLVHHREWMASSAFGEASGTIAPPTPLPAGARVRVTASALHVRAGESTSAPILARLPMGAVVEVARESTGAWVPIIVGVAVFGWVARQYVALVEGALPIDDGEALPAVDMVTGASWVLPFEIVRPRLEEHILVPRCPNCSLVSCSGECVF